MRVGFLFAFVIGIGVVAWLAIRQLGPFSGGPTNSNTANANTTETGGPLTALQRSRDQRRLLDMRALQSALTAFKAQSEIDAYPVVLEDLAPEFIGTLPRDPKDARQYSYTPSGPFYQIGFTLEIGAEGVAAGEHIMTPNGIQ